MRCPTKSAFPATQVFRSSFPSTFPEKLWPLAKWFSLSTEPRASCEFIFFFFLFIFFFFFLLFSKSLFERYLLDWVPFNLGRSLVFRAHIEGGPSGAAPFVRKKNAFFFAFVFS